jgi:hypothetical protein
MESMVNTPLRSPRVDVLPKLDTGKFEFPRRERTDMKKRHKRSRSSLPRSVLEVGSKGAGSLPGDGDQRADAG